MLRLKNILKIALITSAIFLVKTSNAQSVLEAMRSAHAEVMRIDEGSDAFLIGDVTFSYENNKMYCDSAVFGQKKETFKAYGKVHIVKKDTLNLFCDSLHYDIKKEYAKLYGNVRVRDREYKLVTDSLDYDAVTGAGIYRNGGTITSILTNEVLKSDIGYFYPKAKNFNFRNNVSYKSKDYVVTTDTLQYAGYSKKVFFFGPTDIKGNNLKMYCENGWYNANTEEGVLKKNARILRNNEDIAGDSLYFNRNKGIAIGEGNVVIKDSTKSTAFYGDYAESSEKENYAFLTGHAYVLTYDKGDSSFIHADSLFNFMDSLQNPTRILAYNDVKIFKQDIQASCDSLVFNQQDSLMHLYNNPIVWADRAQLTGDTLVIYQNKTSIEKIDILQNAITITEVDDSLKYYNQVGGKTMVAYFKDDSITRVHVNGNSKTVYYMEQENTKDSIIEVERSGMSRLYASNMTLYFVNGDIDGIIYREQPDGAMYPMDKIREKEKIIQGFNWQPALRPKDWKSMIAD